MGSIALNKTFSHTKIRQSLKILVQGMLGNLNCPVSNDNSYSMVTRHIYWQTLNTFTDRKFNLFIIIMSDFLYFYCAITFIINQIRSPTFGTFPDRRILMSK